MIKKIQSENSTQLSLFGSYLQVARKFGDVSIDEMALKSTITKERLIEFEEHDKEPNEDERIKLKVYFRLPR